MVEICKVLALNGPVGGLRMLASTLRLLDTVHVDTDELDEILEENSVSATSIVDLASKVGELVSEYEKSNVFDEDVKYIFNLLKKRLALYFNFFYSFLFHHSHEMIEDGVPSRQNTERDLDANFYWEMFGCLKPIAAIH
jgi:hypothetical protein